MTVEPTPSAPIIVGLGEILWDIFPDGPRFGGAPANFACSVAGLANDSWPVAMVSAVGNDELGQRALDAIKDHNVQDQMINQLEYPTGTVLVQLDATGHATYEFASDTAWDHLNWNDRLELLAKRTVAVCYGTLGQRSAVSRQTIQQFLKATPATCLRIFDINLRPPYWSEQVILESLEPANVIKLNEDELPVLAQILNLTGSDRELLDQLLERCDLQTAVLTRGSLGALLVSHDGSFSDIPGQDVNVVDTVGAGDSFTAAVVRGQLQGLPLHTTNLWAGNVAAFVCSQPGATPRIPQHLRSPPG
jgi:fructokinase